MTNEIESFRGDKRSAFDAWMAEFGGRLEKGEEVPIDPGLYRQFQPEIYKFVGGGLQIRFDPVKNVYLIRKM